MIALNILDIKKCMSLLLTGSLFDEYSLIEAQIKTFCTFSIDGRYQAAFFGDREETSSHAASVSRDPGEDHDAGYPDYVRWGDVREHCFSMIRGKKTPLFFKFVFFFPKNLQAAFLTKSGSTMNPAHLSGLCLNLRFDGKSLVLTTGSSLTVFTTDRSADRAWDEYVRKLFADQGILVSDL